MLQLVADFVIEQCFDRSNVASFLFGGPALERVDAGILIGARAQPLYLAAPAKVFYAIHLRHADPTVGFIVGTQKIVGIASLSHDAIISPEQRAGGGDAE